jgi:hypothetical protein
MTDDHIENLQPVDDSVELMTVTPARDSASSTLYLILPLLFLTVTLLGGFRIAGADHSFIFLKPELICLVLAAILMVLFVRAGLIRMDGWLSHSYSALKNAANAFVLLTMFSASVQVFNALLPEQGLPFWVVGFCFVWTLTSYVFADLDTRRLVRSVAAVIGLAFFAKYLILANLAAPANDGLLQSWFQNPTKEAFTWLLDLPRYASGTGYVQFFTVVIYLFGLFLTPPRT